MIFNHFITVGLPLLLIPYLARVLGPEQLGINAYASSIANFFMAVAVYGINVYGSREIAYAKNDINQRTKVFANIFVLRLFTTLTGVILFLTYVLLFENQYLIAIYLYALYIVAVALDITWLFIGLEDFKNIVLRNIIIKIVPTIATFLLVKNEDDLILYIVILIGSTLLGNIILFPLLKNVIAVKAINIEIIEIRKHSMTAFMLFIPHLIIQIYAQLDRILLGKFSNIYEVSIYDQGQKLVVMILGFLTTISTVLAPRMAHLFSNNDDISIKYYLNKSVTLIFYLSLPAIFGLISISKNLSDWFFGEEFQGISRVINILAPMLLVTTLGITFGLQILVQVGRQKFYTVGLVAGAIVSLFFNTILDKNFGAIGASIAKVLAESTVAIIFIYAARDYISFFEMRRPVAKYLGSSLLMALIVYLTGDLIGSGIMTSVVQIILGLLIYLILLTQMNDSLHQSIIKKVFKRGD